ncbi:MAG: hypothetical protein Q9171_000934 [Xanthocarpia ochracea]
MSRYDSEDRHRQQRTLPSFKDLEARGDFLPEHKCLSYDRHTTPNVAFPPFPWDVGSIDSPSRRQPRLLGHCPGTTQPQDELFNPESKGDTLVPDHTLSRRGSLRKTLSNANGSDDGHLASATEPIIRRHPADELDPPTTDALRMYRGEAETVIGARTAPKRRVSGQTPSLKRSLKKLGQNKSAAIAHMEKERERRLHIGDLIKQLASYIKFDGPKVEILKRTVDYISRREDLEAELGDLQLRYHILSERCLELSRAVSRSL